MSIVHLSKDYFPSIVLPKQTWNFDQTGDGMRDDKSQSPFVGACEVSSDIKINGQSFVPRFPLRRVPSWVWSRVSNVFLGKAGRSSGATNVGLPSARFAFLSSSSKVAHSFWSHCHLGVRWFRTHEGRKRWKRSRNAPRYALRIYCQQQEPIVICWLLSQEATFATFVWFSAALLTLTKDSDEVRSLVCSLLILCNNFS